MSEWKEHMYRAGAEPWCDENEPDDTEAHRKKIEPWLSAVFQSEHLSLLLGSGFTSGVSALTHGKATSMAQCKFDGELSTVIDAGATASAVRCGRGEANFEDQLRVANQLLDGLVHLEVDRATKLREEINIALRAFMISVLETEKAVLRGLQVGSEDAERAESTLISFLLSFASRPTSRDRLNLFTTNYDRLIEYACDHAGIRVLDRFVGTLTPVFRSSRLSVDLHYNPPGIRSEPRLLEGVIRLTKLHGSLDWRFEDGLLKRYGIPFGAPADHPDVPHEPVESVMIYPNAAKDVETSDYPYAELFRDMSAALCRPNSSLVTYGYGFGDDHINRVIADMLTIPSTHLVIISWGDPGGRIERFCERFGGHKGQISILLGPHFGAISNLVEHYLPRPTVDPLEWRRYDLLKRRTAGTSSDEIEVQANSMEESPRVVPG